MSAFLICCGAYLAPLSKKAITTARRIGLVEVDRGDTALKVPDAESYILKTPPRCPHRPQTQNRPLLTVGRPPRRRLRGRARYP